MTTSVVIGRFQPCHEGHLHLISEAAKQSDNLLIMIGSANSNRTLKNPWTYFERKAMLEYELSKLNIHGTIVPLNDHPFNDDQWIKEVEYIVNKYGDGSITIVGFHKEGNDYLTWFPEWNFNSISSPYTISATHVRQLMLETNDPRLPDGIHELANLPSHHGRTMDIFMVIRHNDEILMKRSIVCGIQELHLPTLEETVMGWDCRCPWLNDWTKEAVLPSTIMRIDQPQGYPIMVSKYHLTIDHVNSIKLPTTVEWINIDDVVNQPLPVVSSHRGMISCVTGHNPSPLSCMSWS